MIDLVNNNEFDFWVPLEVNKSLNDQKLNGNSRWIKGIASTEDRDLQGETVSKHGIDFSYFLKYGWFNNDHKPGFDNKVGQPTTAKTIAEGFWVEGFLWEPGVHKIADSIWELALAISASNSNRKLGFSVQGKTIKRAGKSILKCWIQDVAITPAPINTNTWLDVVKSLNAVPEDMWCKQESGLLTPSSVKGVACVCKVPCSSCKKSIDEEKLDIKKDDEDKKSLTTTSGAALVPESLEEDVKDQKWANVSNLDKSLSFDECVSLLQQVRGFSKSESMVITEAVFNLNNNN